MPKAIHELSIESTGAELRLRHPDGSHPARPMPNAALAAVVAELARARELGIRPKLDALGRQLFELLDGPEHWLAARHHAPTGLTLRLPVDGQLRELPWEVLHDGTAFLAAVPGRPLLPIRQVTDLEQEVESADRPLRVLMMACAPNGQIELGYEDDERGILNAAAAAGIDVLVEESGTTTGLAERVDEFDDGHFDVLHLTGHAGFVNGEPVFFFEDEFGDSAPARAEAIRDAVRRRIPRLVFLSACSTGGAGVGGDGGATPSMCEALVRAGFPAVLGWGAPVFDSSARNAAIALFERLSKGDPIDAATAAAREVLCHGKKATSAGAEAIGPARDWHLLQLFADASPLSALVAPKGRAGRERWNPRPRAAVLLDAAAGQPGTATVCDDLDFVGRRRPTQRALRVLKSPAGSDAMREGVVLRGLGGLGKSSLAFRIARRMPELPLAVNRGVLTADSLTEAIIRSLRPLDPRVEAMVREQERIAATTELLRHPRLSLEQRLRTFFENGHVLLILDDFEQNVPGWPAAPEVLSDGRVALSAAAAQVLTTLLGALAESGTDSRVIVTCRYAFQPIVSSGRLHDEPLEAMRGAELFKKSLQTERQFGRRARDPVRKGQIPPPGMLLGAWLKLRARLEEASGGNPRLLERLFAAVADRATDHEALLTRLEGVQAEFRETIALRDLIAELGPNAERFLARVGVAHLPIEREVVAIAAEGIEGWEALLERAVALGLVERGLESAVEAGVAETRELFGLSEVVRPLIPQVGLSKLTPRAVGTGSS